MINTDELTSYAVKEIGHDASGNYAYVKGIKASIELYTFEEAENQIDGGVVQVYVEGQPLLKGDEPLYMPKCDLYDIFEELGIDYI